MTSMIDLPENDEFHGVHFSQAETLVDEETGEATSRVNEVKTGTYTLMSWWKACGNEDTIDIYDESNRATLQYSFHMLGLDDDVSGAIPNGCTAYVDVYENYYDNCPVLVNCVYPEALEGLDESDLKEILPLIDRVNTNLLMGNFEVLRGEDGGGSIRYRASLALEGILVGKVEAFQNFQAVAKAQLQHGMGMLIRMRQGQ